MIIRTAGSIAIYLIAIGEFGGQALAQYYPPAQAYPPQAPAVAAHDLPSPDAPMQEVPLPPVGVGPAYQRPVNARYGQGAGAYPADAMSPPVAGDQGYQPVQPQDYGTMARVSGQWCSLCNTGGPRDEGRSPCDR